MILTGLGIASRLPLGLGVGGETGLLHASLLLLEFLLSRGLGHVVGGPHARVVGVHGFGLGG